MIVLDAVSERSLRAYFCAKAAVLDAGFSDEIDYHDGLYFDELHECDFIREAAWVILSSGMRESVIARKFSGISNAFLDWRSCPDIVEQRHFCRSAALAIFGHVRKIEAILEVVTAVASEGFENIRRQTKKYGPAYLQRFSFIGPATSFHLAKNLGIDVVKPDRHLVRISSALGYQSPDNMCQDLAAALGERACIIDVVFWRFATLDSDYIGSLLEFSVPE